MGREEWNEYRELFKDMKERNERHHEVMFEKLEKINTDIAMLKIKSSLWGGFSGLIVSIISILAISMKAK